MGHDATETRGDNGSPDPGEATLTAAEDPQTIWDMLRRWWNGFLGDQVSPVRLASHLALLLIAGLVLIFSRVDLPRWDVVRLAPPPVEDSSSRPELVFSQQPVGGSPLQETGALLRAPVPFTQIPDRPRLEVITYTVQYEDTVLGIAEQFNLNPNTVVWANQELSDNPFLLAIGQELIILPVDGVLHTVKESDTLKGIASKYRVIPEKIIAWEPNGLANVDQALVPGQALLVPDGDKLPPAPPPKQAPSAPWRNLDFVWPAYGRLTQGFWLPAHPAIDIGAPLGSVVRAADSGVVSQAGWSTYGYGNYVVIRHNDGFETLYAHLHRIDVSPGEYVTQGQQIGLVGTTGRSTGPHLHFEVALGGRSYSPLLYLP